MNYLSRVLSSWNPPGYGIRPPEPLKMCINQIQMSQSSNGENSIAKSTPTRGNPGRRPIVGLLLTVMAYLAFVVSSLTVLAGIQSQSILPSPTQRLPPMLTNCLLLAFRLLALCELEDRRHTSAPQTNARTHVCPWAWEVSESKSHRWRVFIQWPDGLFHLFASHRCSISTASSQGLRLIPSTSSHSHCILTPPTSSTSQGHSQLLFVRASQPWTIRRNHAAQAA